MSQVRKVSLSLTNASVASSNWVILNTFQPVFYFGFAIKKTGSGVAPIVHLEGTMENPLVTKTISSDDIFALVSGVSTSAIGMNVAGEITFPTAAVRISTISEGSGVSTLTLNVLETGKY